MAIVSEEIYSPQSYCDEFLKFCPITAGSKGELRRILDREGYIELRDFPLSKVEEPLRNEKNIVLVDTTYVGSNGLVPEYRWVEVPK